jgi:creatinine amidohydrolase
MGARRKIGLAAGIVLAVAATSFITQQTLTAPLSPIVELKDLTWVEVRSAVQAGHTTIIVPTGGIEQNGPHMVLGKHDYIVGWAASEIARGLGRTLVAPVVSYVPQGEFEPATGHLRFTGTLGVSEPVFDGMLDGIARSLKAGGFKTICFIGDHGGNQAVQKQVAERLSRAWAAEGVRVVHIDAYYDDSLQIKKLVAEGETPARIGLHAGIIDTSELMAIHPAGVDLSRYERPTLIPVTTGVSGDPTTSSASRGRELIAMRVAAAVRQIKALAPTQ